MKGTLSIEQGTDKSEMATMASDMKRGHSSRVLKIHIGTTFQKELQEFRRFLR